MIGSQRATFVVHKWHQFGNIKMHKIQAAGVNATENM